jgi:hypothetical protein
MHESNCSPVVPIVAPTSLPITVSATPTSTAAAEPAPAIDTPDYKPHTGEVLDEAKRTAIVSMLAVGCSRRMAAKQVGCDHATISRTAERDPAFAAQLEEALSGADMKSLRLIDRATDQEKYWRAAAWILERRNPEEYGRRPTDAFTAEQVSEIVSGFHRAVVKAVPGEFREKVMEAFDETMSELARRVRRPYLKVKVHEAPLPDGERAGLRTAADIVMPSGKKVNKLMAVLREKRPLEPWLRSVTDSQLWGMVRRMWDKPYAQVNRRWLRALDNEWERRGDGRRPERVTIRRLKNQW